MAKALSAINLIFRANPLKREAWVKKQLAQIPSGFRILDVGCGGQPFRKYCFHLEYYACDFGKLNEKSIIEGRYGYLDYICDICCIPVKDASFDAILCTEVLEHVPDPVHAIKEMYRILRPGGYLILTAPLGSFLHQTPYHFYGGFTPYWYENFLQEDFIDLKIESNGSFLMYFGQECQRLTRLLFRCRQFTSPLRWLFLPLEIAFTVIFTIGVPLLCSIFDRFISTPGLTVGYHVIAKKK